MKKIISIILTLAMLLSLTTLTSFADDATTNVLVGGTATGSQEKNAASFAVDGVETINGENYWRTFTGKTTHTLTIALSEAKTFDKVSVIMAGSFGGWWSSGTITVSKAADESFAGAETLTTIDMTGAASYSAVFAATTAQYIRFTFTTTSDTSGYSKGIGVLEVGAYNSGEGPKEEPAANVNVLEGGTANADNTHSLGSVSAAIDGVTAPTSDRSTWRTWTNKTSYSIWVELSEAKTFDKVDVYLYGTTGNDWGAGSTITVIAADDAELTNSQRLTTIDMNGSSYYSAVFETVTAKFIKFTFTNSETGKGLYVSEIGAYNTGEGPTVDPSTKINVFEGATASAGSARFSADFAVDGVIALDSTGNNYWRTYTSWTSYSIDLTFEDEIIFDKVDVYMASSYFANKWGSNCKILVKTSKDDTFADLKTVALKNMNNSLEYTLTFPAVTTKYARITFECDASNELGVVEICGYNSGEGFKTENNISKNENYIITECSLGEGKLNIKAMATNYTAAKTFTAIVAVYSGEEVTKLESIDVLDSKTVNFNELTDISFDVGVLSGNYRIFVWENLSGSKPVLEYK